MRTVALEARAYFATFVRASETTKYAVPRCLGVAVGRHRELDGSGARSARTRSAAESPRFVSADGVDAGVASSRRSLSRARKLVDHSVEQFYELRVLGGLRTRGSER